MDRLHEVVVDLAADRLTQGPLVLALRDHHDRHGRIDGADFGNEVEPAAAGHLLVEQDHAVRLAAQQGERVVPVGRLLHREPLPFEEAAVCR